jgi:hypothetical protein
MNPKIFFKIASIIWSSATVNEETIAINLNKGKIKKELSHLSQPAVSRIISIAETIASQETFKMKQDLSPLSHDINSLKKSIDGLSNTVFRFGYMQSSLFAKETLVKDLKQSEIVDKLLIKSIEASLDSTLDFLSSGSFREDGIREIFTNIDINIAKLNSYKSFINKPELLNEVIVRQVNSGQTIENNIASIEKIKSQLQSIDNSHEITKELDKSISDLRNLKNYISKTNDLLYNIEYDVRNKESKVEDIIKGLKSFKASVANGLVLEALQANDKALGYKLKSFSDSLNKTVEFKSLSDIKSAIEAIDAFSLKDEMDKVKHLEGLAGIKTGLGDTLRDINLGISSIKEALVISKDKIIDRVNDPLPQELFVVERSRWEKIKVKFANFSKFFIGYDKHCGLYGHADAIEELRRVTEDAENDFFLGQT